MATENRHYIVVGRLLQDNRVWSHINPFQRALLRAVKGASEPHALFVYGLILLRGIPRVLQWNAREGWSCIQQAADKGVADAQYHYGLHLVHDLYGLRAEWASPTRALSYWWRAAQQGHVEAQAQVATCYRLGLGVKKDKQVAVNLLNHVGKPTYAQQCRIEL